MRTTDMTVNACTYLNLLLSPVNDLLAAWQGPNGRPDVNSYWLATGPILSAINLVSRPVYWEEVTVNLGDQLPEGAWASTAAAVDYWIGRMIGAQVDSATYDALIKASQDLGLGYGPRNINSEEKLRRLVALIASSSAFTYH